MLDSSEPSPVTLATNPVKRTLPIRLWLALCLPLALCACGGGSEPRKAAPVEDEGAPPELESGARGGRLVAALQAEPRTFNPVIMIDRPSQLIRYLTGADLIHINRASQLTEPALAESWSVSEDGRSYTLQLRRGVRFSDGEELDADDVLFTFAVYLDEEIGAPNRPLLVIGGEPIAVHKLDSHTVSFELAEPYAVGERLFDSIVILPEHRLSEVWERGELAAAWGLDTPPEELVGLGPFRVRDYRPGEQLVLERNPHYWKVDADGRALPYIDEIVFQFVAGEDARAIRFQAGESDLISDLSAENFAVLERQAAERGYVLRDLGPGLAYNFLFFNMNDLPADAPAAAVARQGWFRETEFRRAVSEAVDREAIVRLVFDGRATPIGGPVTGGNALWRNEAVVAPERSLDSARARLAALGFVRREGGPLVDAEGRPVRFTVVTNSSNPQRVQMATIIQEDLAELGMEVQVVPLEFRGLIDRLTASFEYDACILALGGGDVDPNSSINVLLSSGDSHLWHIGQSEPATSWEAEIDRLMLQQLTETDRTERKRLFDRVQTILAEQVPLVFLVSPNVLVGADRELGNFEPAVLEPSVLWNADRLFWKSPREGG